MTVRQPWVVPATVLAVHDGDTFKAEHDLGWGVYLRRAVRLAGANAPELGTDAGNAARDYVIALLPVGTLITLTSLGIDKYGRTLAAVTLPDGRDMAGVLIAAGQAVPYGGGARAEAGTP